MNQEGPKRQKRWFKKRYIPVVLLGAFVLWGLWPMLAPRWDQDKCSFGEVSNERYWQMREDVRTDVKKTLSEIRATYKMPISEFIKMRDFDLKKITRWFPDNTPIKLQHISNHKKAYFVRGVFLSELVDKYTKKFESSEEKIAYMHAIMRQMGAWFSFSHKGKSLAAYNYVIHTSLLRNEGSWWLKGLLIRYGNIEASFRLNSDGDVFEFKGAMPSINSDAKNIQRHLKSINSGGCPKTDYFHHNPYKKEENN